MRERGLGTFVDEEEGDIDDESDVELNLDLDSEHNDDNLESDRVLSPIQWIELALQRWSRTGPKLENTNPPQQLSFSSFL